MNPVKITIQGNFWDCQIYRGRLYLFTIDGVIKTINWNKFVDSLQNDNYTNIALAYAFKNGRNLYHPELADLFKDEDVKSLLRGKFQTLASRSIEIPERDLNEFLVGQQDSPFNELHTDSEVISNKFFVLTHNSLESVAIHRNSKRYPVEKYSIKHFDVNAFSIRANMYAKMAISAGDDGLMEYNGSETTELAVTDERRMILVSHRHSSFADYSFLSIYNSSLTAQSFLSYHTWNNKNKKETPERVTVAEYDESNIFKSNIENDKYLSWGSHEKIYRAVNGGLEMVRFNNYAKPGEPIFSAPKLIPLQEWKGKVLSASIAYFGTVLHCEDAVVVMLSDGTFYNIPGEAARIRIYPRSLNYENHLHVIQDDRLEIYSFNNDYFVDQKRKDFGFAYRLPKMYGSYRHYNRIFEPDEDYYDIVKDDENQNPSSTTIDDLPF